MDEILRKVMESTLQQRLNASGIILAFVGVIGWRSNPYYSSVDILWYGMILGALACFYFAKKVKVDKSVVDDDDGDGIPDADVREMLKASGVDSEQLTPRDAVSEQSRLLREYGDDYPASEVFELGRRWALLFDETGDPAHREKALAAMTKARTIDPEYGRDFFDGSALGAFGTLEADPEFGEFV